MKIFQLLEQKIDKKILDSFDVKDELNPDFFVKEGGGYAMRPDVRKRLSQIAVEFIDFLDVKFFIHDVILAGSLANFNWSEYSDIDIHIVIDFDESGHDRTLLEEFFDSKKKIWNSQHIISVKHHDTELYVQDINENLESSGMYSISKNKWIKQPEKENIKIDKKKITQKVKEWMRLIDDLVKHKNDPDTIQKVSRARERLKKYRSSGLEKGGEYSVENLVFKYLRRNEYIKKLLDLKVELMDKNLSLEQ